MHALKPRFTNVCSRDRLFISSMNQNTISLENIQKKNPISYISSFLLFNNFVFVGKTAHVDIKEGRPPKYVK